MPEGLSNQYKPRGVRFLPDQEVEVAVESNSPGAMCHTLKRHFIYHTSFVSTIQFCINIESTTNGSWARIDPSGALASRSGKARGNKAILRNPQFVRNCGDLLSVCRINVSKHFNDRTS